MVEEVDEVGGVDVSVELCGMRLATPLMPAAGTLAAEAVAERGTGAYGALLPKTVTSSPRSGNPPPRISETASGMVNSIGLQNPGVESFLDELDAFGDRLPLLLSVAGDTPEDFASLCGRLADDDRVAGVELNLSCPNVEHSGARSGATFCSEPDSVRTVVAACRETLLGKPLIAKLACEKAAENAAAAEGSGADALTISNTIQALTVDARSRRVVVRGGLSGPAMKPVALRAVYEAYRVAGIPIVGCGGVATGEDAVEFMLAGATAVQVGSSAFSRQPREILRELEGYLEEAGLSARGLTGLLHR
ncbi:dihydroorotate dehydrogenase [Rubrobacter aplysinae]|uniref:dihydroorotate dehydrogenase n=1 Tax=Rubrobacter aplysinae TaxID=909625 RepID=UPI00069F04E5|nr:dihydroorotate dehydrogenase [Rubrobacter aplysinae]